MHNVRCEYQAYVNVNIGELFANSPNNFNIIKSNVSNFAERKTMSTTSRTGRQKLDSRTRIAGDGAAGSTISGYNPLQICWRRIISLYVWINLKYVIKEDIFPPSPALVRWPRCLCCCCCYFCCVERSNACRLLLYTTDALHLLVYDDDADLIVRYVPTKSG